MAKIFIAGGAGYVGSRLIPELLKDNHDITVLDILWFGNTLPKKVKILKKDIFDIDESALAGFDQTIFLAGLSNDPMADHSPSQNFIYNSAAPSYLAYISKCAGVRRFIYASSASVYGFTDSKPRSEDSTPRSSFPYGISKFQGECGSMYLADENFSVISLRKGTISGWAPRMRFDLIVNTMYMKAMTEKKITINNPSIWRPILGMNDVIHAYRLAISAPHTVSGIFNISSGNFTVGDVGKKVAEHFNKKYGASLVVDVKNITDNRNYKILTGKAEKILGFKPKETIESILAELDANIGKGFDFSEEKYYNIQIFKKTVGKK
ncbi:MAG: SDR family oxidoreductase [Patescibacteria group bacterium]